MDGELTLTWDQYGTTYQQVLNDLRRDNDFTDVTVACETRHFLAHKLVLVTCSEFFRSLLKDVHCEHPIIFLRGVDACEMQKLIDFMYMGKIDVPNNEVDSLLATAKSLQIKGLGTTSQSQYETASQHLLKRKRQDNKSELVNSTYTPSKFYPNVDSFYPTSPRQSRDQYVFNENASSSCVNRTSNNNSSQYHDNGGGILSSLLNSNQQPAPSHNYGFQISESHSSVKLLQDQSSSSKIQLHYVNMHSSPCQNSDPESITVSALANSNEQNFLSIKEEPLDCSQATLIEREQNSGSKLLEEINSKDNRTSQIEKFVQLTNQDENVENKSRPFACPICKKSFAKAAILKRHHMAHFRPYSCKLCERSFTRREVLTEHVLEHNGADLRLPCPVCHMTIKRKRNLQAHIKVKHPDYYQKQKAANLALKSTIAIRDLQKD